MLALLCIAPTAHAHAMLVDSQPGDSAVIDRAPAEITLRFDEPVTPLVLKVFDSAGRDVAAGAELQSRGGALRKAVSNLPAGSYIVSWRVVSADAHPIAGAFVFTIGNPAGAPPPMPLTDADDPWVVAVVVARFLLYLSLLPAAGAMLFRCLVSAPLKMDSPGSPRLVAATAGVALVVAAAGLGFKGAQLLAASPWALLDAQTWRAAVVTSAGLSLLVVMGGMAAQLAFLLVGALRRAGPWPPAIAGVTALAGLCLTGHGASGPAWMPPMMALHAAIAAFWLGSLIPLLSLYVKRHPQRVEAAVRFSRIAVALVSVLLLSGAIVALARVDMPHGLLETRYGQVLVFKLLLVATLLVLAAINRWRVTPAMKAGMPKADARFAANVRLELLCGTFLLLATALLTHTPPDEGSHGHQWQATAAGPVILERRSANGTLLKLTAAPARVGSNRVSVTLFDAQGKPLSPVEVVAGFSLPALGVNAIERPLVAASGQFRLDRIDLPVAGRWHIEVTVLVNEFTSESFEFELQVR